MLNLSKEIRVKGIGKKHAVELFLFGDMHNDDPGFYGKGFDRMTEDILSTKNSVAIQMGDLADMANRRTRQALKNANTGGMEDVYYALDKKAKRAEVEAIDRCRPFADRILFGLIGNHGWEYYNIGDDHGKSLDENWGLALNVPLAAAIATVRLDLRCGARSSSYRVMARHGVGGARTETGDHNKLQKELEQYDGVDLFAAGHTHHHYAHKIRPRVFFSKCGEPISRNLHVARTGTFKRNIRQSAMDPSYEEIAGYSPAGLGYIKAKIWMARRRRDGADVTYTQSEVTAVPID